MNSYNFDLSALQVSDIQENEEKISENNRSLQIMQERFDFSAQPSTSSDEYEHERIEYPLSPLTRSIGEPALQDTETQSIIMLFILIRIRMN